MQQLELRIDLFEYYRHFIFEYAHIVKSLQKLKVLEFKKTLKKKNACWKWANKIFQNDDSKFDQLMKNVKIAWKWIKQELCKASMLKFSNFTHSFILYADSFKEWEFEIVIHQKNEKDREHLILFLFKTLQDAEKWYTFIELKTVTLVWALCKASHYFDNENFTVIIDHDAIKSALQTVLMNKRQNHRLNNWVLFLSQYKFWMIIWHWQNCYHRNTNTLSQLLNEIDDIELYLTIIMNMNDAIINQIANALLQDSYFDFIYWKIQQ